MNRSSLRFASTAVMAALMAAAAALPGFAATAAATYSLDFDASKYTVKTATVSGTTVSYRAYEKIVYVKNPVDTTYESMNIYIPTAYFENKAVGAFTAATAPIFLPNTVGGYMPGPAGSPSLDRSGQPSAALLALSKGYVVAEPGARGRTLKDASGTYTGKAPAAIVDLKAAVRYLRYNDKVMPGTAEKIISNGTSAGGALSALLGASGNSADYAPYLAALGAADARDDIFAVSAYCPITNLDNADAAYEWLFNGVNDVAGRSMMGPPAGGTPPAGATGPADGGTPPADAAGPAGAASTTTLTAAQVVQSAQLKALFPAYVNSLGLKAADGSALSLDASGNGSFKSSVKSFIMSAAQKALQAGTDLSKLAWITIKNGTVTDIDLVAYAASTTRLKSPMAFDAADASAPENGLFGTATVDARHFTAFGLANDTAKAAKADASSVKMMNAMSYIGTAGATTAKYWRIRHGTADRDTSLAIPVILATRLANTGASVDFAMPWAVPHSGDYDLADLFAWMDGVTR